MAKGLAAKGWLSLEFGEIPRISQLAYRGRSGGVAPDIWIRLRFSFAKKRPVLPWPAAANVDRSRPSRPATETAMLLQSCRKQYCREKDSLRVRAIYMKANSDRQTP